MLAVLSVAALAACQGGTSTPNANSMPSSTQSGASAVPAVPVQVQALPGDAQIMLTWAASSGASSYVVERSSQSGGPYTQVATPAAASFTDTQLTDGSTYYYVVAAHNTAGRSNNSSQVSAKPDAGAIVITVNPAVTHAISSYIYGINSAAKVSGLPAKLTLDRAGGNRWTAYNWETNASNAGSDYLYENDSFLSSSTVPAEAVRSFIAADQASDMASLVTLQMQGLVAGDENGPVSVAEPPDLSRFKPVVFQKSTQSPAPFTLTPSVTDNVVFMDEFVWALNQKFPGQAIFGSAPARLPVFLQLDNEPELWSSTHLEVQGSKPITSSAYIAKTIALTEAVKDQFPDAVVFGPAHYGFQGIYNWQNELAATPSGSNWFPDKYLAAINSASASYGRPLVDVYDFHWYPEATDGSGNRVTSLTGATLTDAQVQAIVQSPRSLWDTSYSENSWIAEELGGPIYILGRLQSKIAAENPGMKLSISEYNNGGDQHIAGTIAEADNLGIFGAMNLFAANLWLLADNEPYILAGFSAFRNFDGAGSNFGDTSLAATSSSIQDVAVYASSDSKRPGRLVFVAINRSTTSKLTRIGGAALAGTAHLYQMTAASAQSASSIHPVGIGTMAASGAALSVTLPALSVTTIDVY
jgi:hypothetical protein